MDEGLIKEAEAMLPTIDTLNSLMAKGKLINVLNDYKLKVAKINPEDFTSWTKNPEKFVCKHNPKQYEELMAVGYHPNERELVGVIHVKLPYGFGGSCPNSIGSMEYVRFYVDWRNDGDFVDAFEDQNVSRVHVFDAGSKNERKMPLEYSVMRRLEFPEFLLSLLEQNCAVRKVRAILSWNIMPPAGAPHWKPFWGNVFETTIRFHK
ncbi:MAG: hypothetical protein JW999_11130 [Methanotrichaceae archaeon]|nr:hypothetical protein [Methanotrichaceae archaeon]